MSRPCPAPDAFPTVVDSSMLADFVACPRRFAWAQIHKLRPSTESIHLVAGGAFAAGLETARRAFYERWADQAAAVEQGLQTFLSRYTYESSEDDAKSISHMSEALIAYLDKYKFTDDYIQPAIYGGKPCIEFTFCLPLPILHPVTGDPLLFAGRCDMIGVYKDAEFIVDEKTCGALGASWAGKWDMRGQFMAYCWAAREHGYRPTGAIVRGIKITKTLIEFAETIVYHPEWKVQRWYDQMLRHVTRMIACYNTGHWDYAFNDACNDYGGCSFKLLCNSAQPENWLDRYVHNDWTPLRVIEAKA